MNLRTTSFSDVTLRLTCVAVAALSWYCRDRE
jgi:hypothetical protein